MRLLGIDLESTGLDPRGDAIIEVGAVLFQWETKTPLMMYGEFVDPLRDIPEEITRITGITNSLVQEFGIGEADALARIAGMIGQADCVVAHFGNLFDRPFLEGAYARHLKLIPEKVWIDSATDCPYPEEIKTRNLQHLAAEHGFLNPFRHRAVFDVLTMMRVVSCYPIETVISRAMEPTLFVRADVTFDEKEKAKDRGYRWCAPQKIWWRQWKQSDYEAEKGTCGFRTILLPGAPE